jgi:hypothetical protein
MSARTRRIVYRLLSLFLAAGAADAIVQWAVTGFYDWRHLAGALVAAAVMALEQWLKSTDSVTAAPSVRAVDAALEGRSITVPPPKVAVPRGPVVRTIEPDP